jgi:hypothetical protein
MQVWSRGLGRTELTMNPALCQLKEDPETGGVIVYGTVTEPVNWEFKGVITPEDVPGFFRLVFRFCMLKLIFLNAYRYGVYLCKRLRGSEAAAPEPGTLVEKVNEAYDQIMRPRARSVRHERGARRQGLAIPVPEEE